MNGKELTPEQIEQCIKDNVKITDWRLRDGVIEAVMDAVALFAKENNMYKESLSELVGEAYCQGAADYAAVLKNFKVTPHPDMALSIAEAKIKEQVK